MSDKLDEVSFEELCKAALSYWRYYLILGLVITLISTLVKLYQTSEYRSEILLMPNPELSQSPTNGLGQLGGLSNLAGIQLGPRQGVDEVTLALEILRSRRFILDYVSQNDIGYKLIFASHWDRENDRVLYRELSEIEAKFKFEELRAKGEITDTKIWKEFDSIINVSRNSSTGVITVSLQFISPRLARDWLDKLIHDLNEEMRNRTKISASQNLSILEAQIRETQNTNTEIILYNMMERQLQKIMLADSRQDYVLSVIDDAYYPDAPFGMSMILVVLLAFVSTAFFSFFFVLFIFIFLGRPIRVE